MWHHDDDGTNNWPKRYDTRRPTIIWIIVPQMVIPFPHPTRGRVHSSAPLILVLAVRLTQANEIEQFGVSRGAKCAHSTLQCGLAIAFMTYHERLWTAYAQSVWAPEQTYMEQTWSQQTAWGQGQLPCHLGQSNPVSISQTTVNLQNMSKKINEVVSYVALLRKQLTNTKGLSRIPTRKRLLHQKQFGTTELLKH